MPDCELSKMRLEQRELTKLTVGGQLIAVFDNDTQQVRLADYVKGREQFQSLLYAMMILGTHWGWVSPDACDDLHLDLEDRLHLNGNDIDTGHPVG